jgi:hypothetical protein
MPAKRGENTCSFPLPAEQAFGTVGVFMGSHSVNLDNQEVRDDGVQ